MHINHPIKTPSHLRQSSRFESMCPFCHLLPSYTMHQEFWQCNIYNRSFLSSKLPLLFCCIRWWRPFYSSSSGQPFSLYWFSLLLRGHCKPQFPWVIYHCQPWLYSPSTPYLTSAAHLPHTSPNSICLVLRAGTVFDASSVSPLKSIPECIRLVLFIVYVLVLLSHYHTNDYTHSVFEQSRRT